MAPQPPSTSAASAPTSTSTPPKKPWQSAWRFNFETWQWEIDTEGGITAFLQNKALAAERDLLAARRWGGGRDTLRGSGAESLPSTSAETAAVAASLFPNMKSAAAAAAASSANATGPGSLDDLGGLFEAKKTLRETVLLYLKHPGLLAGLGLRTGLLGVLLHGPPGTGKTLLSRAIAREAGPGVHCEFISCAEVAAAEGGASRLRGAFQTCRRLGPSILVLDEIDCLCPSRDAAGGGTAAANDPVFQTAATLLELLDGNRTAPTRGESAAAAPPLVVLATTSRRHALDPAIMRAGRIDREIALGLPSAAERTEILDRLLRAAARAGALAPDVDLPRLAERTRGFAPADLYAVCAAASLLAIKRALFALEKFHPDPVEDLAAAVSLPLLKSGVLSGALLDRFSGEAILAQTFIDASLLAAAAQDVQPSNMRNYAFSVELPKVSFAQIGGLEAVKRELTEAVLLPLQRPDLFRRFGARPPRGVMLYGPPGTGKTILAKAVATCCGAHFLPVQGPQLLSMWLGESERNVREVFATARRSKPCVIFFDELDSIATRREGSAGSDAGAARVLNQLLVEMDGLSSGADDDLANGGVFILAATNRPEMIDPALLRPGRFDALIHVSLPDLAARLQILEGALGGGRCAPEVNLREVAEALEGFSGADVTELCQKAVRLCIRGAVQQGSGSAELRVSAANLQAAFAGARRSVSLSEVRRFEAMEKAIHEGRGLPSATGARAEKSTAQATAMVRLLSSELSEAKLRIQELEAALGLAPAEQGGSGSGFAAAAEFEKELDS